MSKKIIGGAIAVLAALSLVGCTPDGLAPTASSSTSSTPSPVDAPYAPNLAASLAALSVVDGYVPSSSYDRVGDFGESWLDVDGNGCDTRNDILDRDLTDVRLDSDGCVVLSGVLDDPYTNTVIDFRRGMDTSADVQIDHVVALSNAWASGADRLSQTQRIELANDPMNLFAVDGPTNTSKSDSSADEWLPPNGAFWCTYIDQQIQVKTRYSLSVTTAEHDAMADVISRCLDPVSIPTASTIPTSEPTPAPTTEAPAPAPVETTPAPAPALVPDTATVSYANCDAVRAAGAAPLNAGQPGYSTSLDRDGDGVACE